MGIPIDVVENGKNERDAKVKFALDMENSEFVDLCKRGGVHKFRTIEGVDDEI